MSRLIAVAFLLTCASPVHSATRFEIEIESNSRIKVFQGASVTSDGPRIHIALDLHADAVTGQESAISQTGPTGFIGVNPVNQTWYDLEGASPLTMRSHLLSSVMTDSTRVEKVRVSVTEEAGPTAETGARRYVARVSYETADQFEGHKIRVSRGVTALITTDPQLSQIEWPADMIFRTDVPQVDEHLRERMSAIGFPISIELSFTRIYHGGSPTTESIRMNVRDIRQVIATPELFETPSGYRNQKPIVGAPGG